MEDSLISLDTDRPIWGQFFTVSPLVIIGTLEEGRYDLAPKHMVMPLGWDNYFGFICTPRHSTYRNIKREGAFTVSFPTPEQVVVAGLTATARCDLAGEKPVLEDIETFPAELIEGVFIRNAYLFLECELDRIVDGFGVNALIAGKVVAAHIQRDILRTSESEDAERILHAPILAYLNPGRFASIKKTFAFPFPSRFQK